jgi:transposase-like protein
VIENNCKNSLTHQQNNSLRKSIAQCGGNLHIQFERMIEVKKFKNVLAVLDYFKDEKDCKVYLEQQRWGGKPCCPKCGFTKVYRTNRGFKCASVACHKKFSVTVGTVMEQTKIKLRYWFAAIYLITAHKKGISSCQLARDLGVTQRTAWFLNHRIRKMMAEEIAEHSLTDTVQIDETYVGGKRHNMHGKRRKMLRETYGTTGSAEKLIVFGMLQQDGKLITMTSPTNDGAALQPLIKKYIKPGSTIITDQHGAYAGLGSDYNHIQVYHSRKNYVAEDGHHNNSIESAWSLLKRGYVGIYHYMSAKHLNRYCNEFSYRFNTRGITDLERFADALTRTTGRLMYKHLIAA